MWKDLSGYDAPGLESDWPASHRRPLHDYFLPGQWVITQRGDTCHPGAFVWCTAPRQGVARVVAVYALAVQISGAQSRAPSTLVIVDLFDLKDRHPVYDCPRLAKCGQYIIAPDVCPRRARRAASLLQRRPC